MLLTYIQSWSHTWGSDFDSTLYSKHFPIVIKWTSKTL